MLLFLLGKIKGQNWRIEEIIEYQWDHCYLFYKFVRIEENGKIIHE